MRRPARYKRALPRRVRSSQYPFLLFDADVRLFWFVRALDHHGDEQIGDARAAYLAQRFELVPVNAIKQQYAATENRPFVHRFEGARGGKVLGIHHYFEVT